MHYRVLGYKEFEVQWDSMANYVMIWRSRVTEEG